MNNGSGHLDHAEFLDYVEGVVLTPSVRARVEAAMAADPRLARLVAGMQADRAGLVALAQVAAPANLLEKVEAALEREALVGLANSETATTARLAVSRVTYSHPSVIATIGQSRWLRPVAMAAGLALVASAAFVGIKNLLNRPVKTAPMVVISNDQPPLSEDRPELTLTPKVEPEVLGLLDGATEVATGPDVTPPLAKTEPFGLPLGQAVALAQEGRLIIHVRAGSAAAATERLEAIMDRPTADHSLARISDQSLVTVLAAAREALESGAADRHGPHTPVIASDAPIVPKRFFLLEAPGAEPSAWRQTGDAFALHVHPSTRALRDLLETLSRGDRVKIVLEEAPRSLNDELGPDHAALMWWTSAQTWDKRAAVSVVVETP
jgi:hypothetical protein